MSAESESGVIARAAMLLKVLETQPHGVSLSQLARLSGLPRTTVHRLVGSLEAQQFVSTGSRGVSLGPAMARLAAAAHTDITALARPAIEALGRRTRETVDLCVFRGLHAISVDQYASDQELRVISPIGTAFPIHATAHGKALLAALPPEEAAALLSHPLAHRTAHTLDAEALTAQLAAIRTQGYATDREEHAGGVCGLGVVLHTALTERYALSLAVPAYRFSDSVESLLRALMQCKAEIEALAG
ncbi:IclR family transcriptional regulator [Chimaeribacter californicus]|uniref:IclR family transcriptional regulator n=1 Tax=Chimaeribacter californicus TaxID=2060067 RepID=A0A2N5DWN0_9GAMM|nr:IclR family transcriptional regulator [Chimaeribacter californicus]PLR31660.1 IclR family transcriptional regulator [Chimaeribacter californicus]